MKKKRSKETDKSLVDMLIEMVEILRDCKGMFDKSMVDSMMATFADVMADSPAFHKLLADPKTDLKQLEPILKKILKKKKQK